MSGAPDTLLISTQACTIVSGAIAERATFMAYALYSVILIGFVYPPIVNMMWVSGKFTAWTSGPRLFGGCGVIDFAGSGTVHLTGGVAALIALIFIGPRKGFPDKLPEGSPVFQSLGVFILWMGWYGFNCCSTLYIAGLSQSVATVAITTTLGAAAGCISATAIGYGMKQYIDPGYVMNGVLAGLVSITSPCAVCSPVGAIIIGLIGGGPCPHASTRCAKAAYSNILLARNCSLSSHRASRRDVASMAWRITHTPPLATAP